MDSPVVPPNGKQPSFLWLILPGVILLMAGYAVVWRTPAPLRPLTQQSVATPAGRTSTPEVTLVPKDPTVAKKPVAALNAGRPGL